MTQRLRWPFVTAGLIVAVALGSGVAGAADKTKVNQATQRVQQGAKQIGQGNVGPGVTETAKGVGNTVVEGAKFTGQTLKEFFTGKK